MGTKKQSRRNEIDTYERMNHNPNDGKIHIISYDEEGDCAVCTCGDRTKI